MTTASDRSRPGATSDFRKYIQALRRHVLLIVTIVVIGVGVSLVISETSAKRYSATAELLVTPVASNDETFLGISVLRESGDPQSRSVLTVANLVNSVAVAAQAKTLLNTTLSPTDLLRRISIQPVSQADIVSVTASGPTARIASDTANAFVGAIIQQRNAAFQKGVATQIGRIRTYLKTLPAASQNSNQAITLQQRLAQLVPLVAAPDPTLGIASAATPPTAPVWPKPKLAAAIALLATLLLASALAIAIEFWNPNVRDENEIMLDHRLPILARVPLLKRSVASAYLTGKEPLPRASWESYRRLRASLERAPTSGGPANGPLSIIVTSASPGEGKTMTSLNLALSFATAGKKVVLVDGDLRHPMIASIFRIAPPRGGIATAFESAHVETLLAAPPSHPNLRLLLARPENAMMIDGITPERVTSLIASLERYADVVIFDTAPVGEAAETLAFAAAADAIVVAIRLGSTRRERLADTLHLFAQHGVALAGVVVTSDRGSQAASEYYAYAGPDQPTLGSTPEIRLPAVGPAARIDRERSKARRASPGG